MWYSVKKSIELAFAYSRAKKFTWDIIIRARWDWTLQELIVQPTTSIHVPISPGLYGHKFNWQGEEHTAHNDQFAWGPPHQMTRYASTYDQIPHLYNSGVDFCSELLLTANLLDGNIPITYDNIDFEFGYERLIR